jgi:hypothetical protein
LCEDLTTALLVVHKTDSVDRGRNRREIATTSHFSSRAKWRTAAKPTKPDAPAMSILFIAFMASDSF